MKLASTLAIGILVIGIACRDPYRPDILSSGHSFLVVDGMLIAGVAPTTIRLSRTFQLDDTARIQWETGASVFVESSGGSVRQLTMHAPGYYKTDDLQIDMNQEYRLRIETTDGSEYLSEYVVPKTVPAMDSIGWKRNANGVEVYVNSFDPSGNTRYYRWDYDETYEISSRYFSYFIYEDSAVRERILPDEQVYTCWKYDSSKSIVLGSTVRLSEDRLFEAPVAFFPAGDEKLSVRYSILLRQYAISKEAYEYLDLMKKNTESIGTIFDAQPSELKGNIRCVNRPEEQVIGFVMASTFHERRKFISNSEIGPWTFQQNCPWDTIKAAEVVEQLEGGWQQAYQAVYSEINPTVITGYLVSYSTCVDCRERKGSLDKPSYW